MVARRWGYSVAFDLKESRNEKGGHEQTSRQRLWLQTNNTDDEKSKLWQVAELLRHENKKTRTCNVDQQWVK